MLPNRSEWIKGAIVTLVVLAIVFRVPQIKGPVIGQ